MTLKRGLKLRFPTTKQLYDYMRLQGHGEETPSTVIQFYESAAGVKVRKS